MPAPAVTSVSGVILAGGRSQRLGIDKAFLPILGQPLVARTVQKLAALSDDVIVVTNQPASYAALRLPVRLVRDEVPGQGALMGIYSGMKAARHPRAVVVACDMPLLSLPLLRYMTTLAAEYDVVIPEIDGMFEPLHAVYGQACLQPMARLLAASEHQIIAFFPEVRVRAVDQREIDAFDPDRLSFLNVNTREDWERAQLILADVGLPDGA
jgi:molybdopterin-guanine dinucleotide biosynthesis protein A